MTRTIASLCMYMCTHPTSCIYEIVTERNLRLRIIGASGYLLCTLSFVHKGYSPLEAVCLATVCIEITLRFLILGAVILYY